MEEKEIPDLNIFMMCRKANENAYQKVPDGFHIRNLKREELDTWYNFPFDTVEGDKKEYICFMKDFFQKVYGEKENVFFDSCLVICDKLDKPLGTCFAWKAYNKFWTIHWFKVYKNCEGRGLGRAILTEVMKSIPKEEYPVYLHTQPGSFRAIKIYSDFGFAVLKDEKVGKRKNHYKKSLKYLKYFMKDYYNDLKFAFSDGKFSEEAEKSEINQF